MRPLASVEEALEQVLDHVPEPRHEEVDLNAALGRVLAADVVADRDYPAFPRSRVDGYAVRAADVTAPGELPVAMEIPAGATPPGPLSEGAVARIFTGAPAPEGADCVVMQEDCEARAEDGGLGRVHVGRVPDAGQHLVPVAYERARGETVAAAGDVVTAALAGALASVGAVRPLVSAAPVGRVVSTGDELVPVETTPGPGQIRNGNAPALRGVLASFGAVDGGAVTARDDPASLGEALAFALEADVCLLTGGVSVGDYDLVPAALEAAGVTNVFHGVRMQPGKPLWFGIRGRTLVFGLPGNPVSALVTATLFVRPAVRRLLGLAPELPAPRRAVLDGPLGRGTWRRRYDPVRLVHEPDGRVVARPVGYRGSGDIFGFALADALAVVPEEAPAPAAGDDVDVVPLSAPLA
jgi:molybdopterin molybdotransferase